jgi:hypothetical protein
MTNQIARIIIRLLYGPYDLIGHFQLTGYFITQEQTLTNKFVRISLRARSEQAETTLPIL